MPIAAARPSHLPTAFASGTALCLLALAAGVPLGSAPATMIACGAILAIGLPHGTLDLDLLRQAQPGASRPAILLIYLAFGAAMAAAWFASPVAALALFYVLAVAHFGEDWSRTGSALLARGMALALLALPALSRPDELSGLFAALAGAEASTIFVDLLRLTAPVATLVALAAIGLLWSSGARGEAAGGGLALAAMALLPPVIGFALFFCLYHSPRHLRDALATLSAVAPSRRGATIVLLTLAAGAIVAIVHGYGAALAASERMVMASFVTLSILTLPHMAVPLVLRALPRHAPWTAVLPAPAGSRT